MSKPLRFMDNCPHCSQPICCKQCLNQACDLGRLSQNEQELIVDLENAEALQAELLKALKLAADKVEMSCTTRITRGGVVVWDYDRDMGFIRGVIAKAEGGKP